MRPAATMGNVGTAGRRWLAGAATGIAAIGLVLLFSAPLLAAASLSAATRLAYVLMTVAMVTAAWFAASAPTMRVRGVLTPLLAISLACPLFVGWTDGPALIRVIARAVEPFAVPLVLHLLATGIGGIRKRALRLSLWICYGSTAVVSLAILVARDAFYDIRCWADCDIPPVLAGLPLVITKVGGPLECAIAVLALTVGIVAAAHGLIGARRPASTPIVLSALAALGTTAATVAVAATYRPAEGPQLPTMTVLSLSSSVTLTLLAISVASASARLSARAGRMERIADELSQVSEAGSMQAALAQLLGDESLTVRFPFGPDGTLIDSSGRIAAAGDSRGRTQVEIRRGGAAIAFIDADADRVEARALTDGLGSAARIAIDNERLRAEILAHLDALRLSRERIVEAADAQRRRTEQDLHDGAQSGLVGLLYTLTARSRSHGHEWASEDVAVLEDATSALRGLVATVREIAHGVYPADLARTGLPEAVRSLTERTSVHVDLSFLIRTRPPERVERLAYLAARRLIDTAEEPITLTITSTAESLRLTCTAPTIPHGLADRVAVLSGTLQVEDDVIVMEIPCA